MKIEKLFLSLLGLTLFIPSFGSVDLLAPRTLYLSLINLIIFVYYKNLIFSTIKQIGLVFYLFSLLTLLSFLSFFMQLIQMKYLLIQRYYIFILLHLYLFLLLFHDLLFQVLIFFFYYDLVNIYYYKT